MQAADMPHFLNMMTGLSTLYGKPINEPLIEIYWRALLRFEFADVRQAMQAHIDNPDTGQYMPKPADVVHYLQGSGHTQALKAWSSVTAAIRHVGAYQSVVFDDANIHAVIAEMGGWPRLCKTTEKEMPFKAHEFEKRYMAYVLHPPDTHPKQLTGIFEHQNQLQGYAATQPILIGHEQKALRVYQQGSDTRMSHILLKLNPPTEEHTV